MVVAVAVCLLAGTLRYTHDGGTSVEWLQTLVVDLTVLGVAAAAEEALFRGYGFQVLVRGFGTVVALIGSSAIFALAHIGNPNVTAFALLNIFLAGVLLGLAYLRTHSLWFATAVHLGWNWTMASLFDLPVSGIALFQTPLYEPVTRGVAWIGGGSFGPEAGIAASIGLACCLLILSRRMHGTYRESGVVNE
jgi:membrane protease YdiL (CAAX protease family)